MDNWIKEILEKEEGYHFAGFGKNYNLSKFEKTLEKYSKKQIELWKKDLREPHFLPPEIILPDSNFPGIKIKPSEDFYKWAEEGKIKRMVNNQLIVDKQPFDLRGIAVLIDIRLKPKYDGGNQMWENDEITGEVISSLRNENIIENFEIPESRFNVSADDIKIINFLLSRLPLYKGVKKIRNERYIEFLVISQIYLNMSRKDDGHTDTWVWLEEYFKDCSIRLFGGDSVNGGLVNVDYDSAGCHCFYRSFRPLAVL